MQDLYDQEPWLRGLSAEDIAKMQAQGEVARNGGFKLTPHEKFIAHAFNYKVTSDISGAAFELLPDAFPNQLANFPKPSTIKTQVPRLTGMSGIKIHCCVNSCVAFTGPYENLESCPVCATHRYKVNKNRPDQRVPRRTFLYIPLIPRLVNMYRDKETARLLRYRAHRRHRPGAYADIFDGQLYRDLLGKRVRINGETLDDTYFSSPTDVALGLSTDGFGPFKSRSHQCWPLVLFNYNLNPKIRTRLENLLCVGVIPGPNTPKELDSFLEPLISELESLGHGVAAFDGEEMRPFCLRAHLIACFGDMPAVAKLMCMKGHNGKHPCRACKVVGIRYGTHYYIPLARPFAQAHEGPRTYDPYNLPMRTHQEFLRDAIHVEEAQSRNASDTRGRDTGINGLSTLAQLSSLTFPGSFPHDFMHLMFENVIKTLLDLWTRSRDYEKFGSGVEGYLIDGTVWAAIGAACSKSGDTIPSSFGGRVPNIQKKRSELTSESILIFATLLAPGLLLHKFTNDAYYRHFIELVKLINQCIGIELTTQDVQYIREGFAKWVKKYEDLYYMKTQDRLRVCTSPIHALLHVADDIERMGPVWAYWAFAMERYCGFLARSNKSRRYPYASLDRRVLQVAQLSQLKLLYGLRKELELRPNRLSGISGVQYCNYPGLVFGYPRRVLTFSPDLLRKASAFVAAYLGFKPVFVKAAMSCW